MRYVSRFCSEFTNHELKLQTFCCHKNTQGEENTEIDNDLHIVEEIKGIGKVKGTWKLTVKWQGSDDETEELLVNFKQHDKCECLLQSMF